MACKHGNDVQECGICYDEGVSEATRQAIEKKIYGEELAEQFAMQDELNAYNRGED